MAEITKEDVIKFIENMTVLELSELVKELEEKFGVSAAAPMAMAAMPVAGDAGAAAAEEQTEFDVILTSF
ncbi:MAG: 50S ribosomal protein L7/L12, partial [Deltaproteobacteria bacterium]|nr:50S ribosomal protein L7/L12 [Deltaproteobacteria bacterium]